MKVVPFLLYLLLSFSIPFAADRFPDVRDFQPDGDYSSELERRIRAQETSTRALVLSTRPRFWIRGNWDWEAVHEEGSFASRFVPGPAMYLDEAQNDKLLHEIVWVMNDGDQYLYNEFSNSTLARRYLWTIMAAEAARRENTLYHLQNKLPEGKYLPGYSGEVWPLQHSQDQLLQNAKTKYLRYYNELLKWPSECHTTLLLHASAGYDWLVNRTFSDGTPVFSEAERQQIQGVLVQMADVYKQQALERNCRFYSAADLGWFAYTAVGLALYEPDGQRIAADLNAKAAEYLDDFDTYWIGQILPFMNEQGGTGGWHAGLSNMSGEWWFYGSEEDVITYQIAPLLYAHYTATGQSYESSLMSSGFLKYAAEFQNYMIYPHGDYLAFGPNSGGRYRWIGAYFPNARRRFSTDPEQRLLGELAAWINFYRLPLGFREGSYDLFDQALFEEKWPNPRSPEELGCGTRHFAKLGWVAMRAGFQETDLASLMISQRYHWSPLAPQAQNSFSLYWRGELLDGFRNTLWLGNRYQRSIDGFPTIQQGFSTYLEDPAFAVGPGIEAFTSSAEYDYICGEAQEAYETGRVQNYCRQLFYLKPDKFLILDRVTQENASAEPNWRFHAAFPAQLSGDTLASINNGRGAVWVKKVLPRDASLRFEEGFVRIDAATSQKQHVALTLLQLLDADRTLDDLSVAIHSARAIELSDRWVVEFAGWTLALNKADHEINVSPPISDVTGQNRDSSPQYLGFISNYPNPFNPDTMITFYLGIAGPVDLSIYDLSGRCIKHLVNGHLDSGTQSTTWDGRDQNGMAVPSALYVAVLKTSQQMTSKKLLLIR